MNMPRFMTAFVLVAAVFAACKNQRAGDEEAGGPTSPPVVSVRVAPLQEGTIEDCVTSTGKMDVLRKQKITSPVTGTLLSLPALEGMSVKRGDVLAVIRPREAQTAITGAEALLRNARTDAERREAQAALDLARSTENTVNLRAGFDGIVASRNVTEGELLTENAELLTVVDLASIIFVAEVPLQDAPHVGRGQHAFLEFQTLPGRKYPALVDAVYPGSEFQSQTIGVRLRLVSLAEDVRRQLKPSMMGICRIVTGVHKDVLLAPKDALLRDDEKNTYALVIAGPDSIAYSVSVTVGVTNDSVAEVRGPGLTKGVLVVVEGNYALPDSTRVRW
jgi:membrane fusion protein (multidrug efflux system)